MSLDLNTPLPSPHGGTIGSWADRILSELARTPVIALYRANNQDCQELRFCKAPRQTVDAISDKATTYLQDPEWLAGWLSFYCVNSPRAFNPRTLLRLLSRRAFLQAFQEVALSSTNPVTLEVSLASRQKVLHPVVAEARSKSPGRRPSMGQLGPADPKLVAEFGANAGPSGPPSPAPVPEVPGQNGEPQPVPATVPTPDPAGA